MLLESYENRYLWELYKKCNSHLWGLYIAISEGYGSLCWTNKKHELIIIICYCNFYKDFLIIVKGKSKENSKNRNTIMQLIIFGLLNKNVRSLLCCCLFFVNNFLTLREAGINFTWVFPEFTTQRWRGACHNAAGLCVCVIITLFQQAQFESPATTFHCFPVDGFIISFGLCALSALIWCEKDAWTCLAAAEVKVLQRRISVFHTTMTSARRCAGYTIAAHLCRVLSLTTPYNAYTQISVFVSGARVYSTTSLFWLGVGASVLY